MDLNKNRQDDLKIYNNLDFYEEPKEYFKDCLKIINKKLKIQRKFWILDQPMGHFLITFLKLLKVIFCMD